jgi:hypothetical protein
MRVRPVHPFFRLLSWALFMTLAGQGMAQQTIHFSDPGDSDPGHPASARSGNPNTSDTERVGPEGVRAPVSPFGTPGPQAGFDLGRPAFSSGASQQWQKFLKDKKNWTLMTPEQILGVPTPRQILGVADPKEDPNLSDEERYLQRQGRQSTMAASNAWHSGDNNSSSIWRRDNSQNAFSPVDPGKDGAAPAVGQTVFTADRNVSGLFDPKPSPLTTPSHSAASTWASPFQSPAPVPKPTADQLEGMERFRALMDQSSPDKPQASSFPIQPVATPDPNIDRSPFYNPVGASFRALQTDISRPSGLKGLPGVTGPPPVPKKPSPLVQPPPWMQNTLQSGNLPQRQF